MRRTRSEARRCLAIHVPTGRTCGRVVRAESGEALCREHRRSPVLRFLAGLSSTPPRSEI